MSLPKTPIPELIEDLRELARAGYVETFPDVAQEDMSEAEAADVLEHVEKLLLDIVNGGGEFAARALSILNRQG